MGATSGDSSAGWRMPGLALLRCPPRWSSLPSARPNHRTLQVLNTLPPAPLLPASCPDTYDLSPGGVRRPLKGLQLNAGETACAGVARGWAVKERACW